MNYQPQDIGSWSVEEQGDWSWLVSLWVYRDPVVTSTGLTVATALTIQPQGSQLLHESLTQVSGGVWGAALRLVCLLFLCCEMLAFRITLCSKWFAMVLIYVLTTNRS